MRYSIFSYRYAREILEHHTNANAFNEIISVVSQAPLFIYPNKSSKNARLDVVQQCMNTWFDRAFAVECGWLYHPLATAIQNSRLAADFRKPFPNITVQAEVQFGNMSRWYSDIFKLQTAYSQSLVNLGLSIVPMGALGKRIDSNIVSYERVVRELPSADLSITLPILVIGIEPDEDTQIVDLRQTKIPLLQLTQRGSEKNRYRVVHALTNGADLQSVTSESDTGPMANPIVDPVYEDEE
ncbi:hypothetical protein Brsp03_02413 [Brucella sp. NBRC 12951]|uniref:BglII/BstYI family type II restriction endonuclease n=1 Tax=Brucella sp. NBRC 12951 TaxID=3075479 RepID=UPI0030A42D2A